ncbi:MAG: hypothetical protein R2688_08215 [Fimbriimonadaceae bacterium]
MLNKFVGKKITVERTSDGKKFAGIVTLVQSPLMRVRLDEVSNIQVDTKSIVVLAMESAMRK